MLLFEELEPRLLFSADAAEPLAAEAVQEQIEQAPVIIIAESTETQETATENGAENPAGSSSVDPQTQTPLDTFEVTDHDTGSETIPSEPASSASDILLGDTTENVIEFEGNPDDSE